MFKIRSKILVIYLSVVIIPIILISAFFIFHTTESLKQDKISDLQQDTKNKVDKAMFFLRTIEEDIRGLYFNFIPVRFDPSNAERYWIFIESIDKSIVYSPVYTFYKIFGLIVLLLTVGVVVVTFIFSNKLTRPLNELVKGATNIAEGNLDYRIAVKSNDEIALLTSSFNKMTSQLGESRVQLQDYADNLKQKVDDKTKEILTKARRQQVIAEIGNLLWTDLDLQEIMDRVVNIVSSTLNVKFCKILLLDKSQKISSSGKWSWVEKRPCRSCDSWYRD